MLIALAIAAAAQGPISKFGEPDLVLESRRSASEIERCLIDTPGRFAPSIYRQPDRPNQTTIVWSNGSGVAIYRVDLMTTASGTRIKSWKSEKQVRGCGA